MVTCGHRGRPLSGPSLAGTEERLLISNCPLGEGWVTTRPQKWRRASMVTLSSYKGAPQLSLDGKATWMIFREWCPRKAAELVRLHSRHPFRAFLSTLWHSWRLTDSTLFMHIRWWICRLLSCFSNQKSCSEHLCINTCINTRPLICTYPFPRLYLKIILSTNLCCVPCVLLHL